MKGAAELERQGAEVLNSWGAEIGGDFEEGKWIHQNVCWICKTVLSFYNWQMEAVGSWFRKDDVKTVFHFLSLGLACFLSAPAQWDYVAFSGEKRI